MENKKVKTEEQTVIYSFYKAIKGFATTFPILFVVIFFLLGF
jgi:hypothetical protein